MSTTIDTCVSLRVEVRTAWTDDWRVIDAGCAGWTEGIGTIAGRCMLTTWDCSPDQWATDYIAPAGPAVNDFVRISTKTETGPWVPQWHGIILVKLDTWQGATGGSWRIEQSWTCAGLMELLTRRCPSRGQVTASNGSAADAPWMPGFNLIKEGGDLHATVRRHDLRPGVTRRQWLGREALEYLVDRELGASRPARWPLITLAGQTSILDYVLPPLRIDPIQGIDVLVQAIANESRSAVCDIEVNGDDVTLAVHSIRATETTATVRGTTVTYPASDRRGQLVLSGPFATYEVHSAPRARAERVRCQAASLMTLIYNPDQTGALVRGWTLGDETGPWNPSLQPPLYTNFRLSSTWNGANPGVTSPAIADSLATALTVTDSSYTGARERTAAPAQGARLYADATLSSVWTATGQTAADISARYAQTGARPAEGAALQPRAWIGARKSGYPAGFAWERYDWAPVTDASISFQPDRLGLILRSKAVAAALSSSTSALVAVTALVEEPLPCLISNDTATSENLTVRERTDLRLIEVKSGTVLGTNDTTGALIFAAAATAPIDPRSELSAALAQRRTTQDREGAARCSHRTRVPAAPSESGLPGFLVTEISDGHRTVPVEWIVAERKVDVTLGNYGTEYTLRPLPEETTL